MKANSIKMVGTLQGNTWSMGECTKEFKYTFTENQQPFSFEWQGLDQALQRITNDGDFQFCRVRECWIETAYRSGNKTVIIDKELPDCKLTHDYIVPEDERVYPEYGNE
jgi:hypothetical protein